MLGEVGDAEGERVQVRQHDGRSCGAAVLLVLAAERDPALASWLRTGVRAVGWENVLLGAMPSSAWRLEGATERSAAGQRALRHVTNRVWPLALGTPPWGLAHAVTRVTGHRWHWRRVRGSDADALRAAVAEVERLAGSGVQVPLYVGGHRGQGLFRNLPRHVVLVLGAADGVLQVYEPHRGTVQDVAAAILAGPPGPALRALGGWTTLHAVVLPVGACSGGAAHPAPT